MAQSPAAESQYLIDPINLTAHIFVGNVLIIYLLVLLSYQ